LADAAVGCPLFFSLLLCPSSLTLLLGSVRSDLGARSLLQWSLPSASTRGHATRCCRPYLHAAIGMHILLPDLDSDAILGLSSRCRERNLACTAAQGTQLEYGVVRVGSVGIWDTSRQDRSHSCTNV
jgi:hypothetical protein